MYDRGSWEQLWNAHSLVNPKEWAPLDLPIQEDVKGLELEVVVSPLGGEVVDMLITTAELPPSSPWHLSCEIPGCRSEGRFVE